MNSQKHHRSRSWWMNFHFFLQKKDQEHFFDWVHRTLFPWVWVIIIHSKNLMMMMMKIWWLKKISQHQFVVQWFQIKQTIIFWWMKFYLIFFFDLNYKNFDLIIIDFNIESNDKKNDADHIILYSLNDWMMIIILLSTFEWPIQSSFIFVHSIFLLLNSLLMIMELNESKEIFFFV